MCFSQELHLDIRGMSQESPSKLYNAITFLLQLVSVNVQRKLCIKHVSQ
jgi:hypothetical protein